MNHFTTYHNVIVKLRIKSVTYSISL